MRRNLVRLLKKVGLPKEIRLYDLRHTCATLLLMAGINPKVVSERLGHASVAMTLDVHSHVLPSMQVNATAKLENMLSGNNWHTIGTSSSPLTSHEAAQIIEAIGASNGI